MSNNNRPNNRLPHQPQQKNQQNPYQETRQPHSYPYPGSLPHPVDNRYSQQFVPPYPQAPFYYPPPHHQPYNYHGPQYGYDPNFRHPHHGHYSNTT